MYNNRDSVFLKSVKIVNQEPSPKEPPKEPPPAPPPTEPREAPGKKFTEAAPTPIIKSTDPKPPSFPRK